MVRIELTHRGRAYLEQLDTLRRLQAQIDGEAGQHVRVYDTVAEVLATCREGACTLPTGHRSGHYDGLRGVEL